MLNVFFVVCMGVYVPCEGVGRYVLLCLRFMLYCLEDANASDLD